jgi:hypothetical protein
MHKADAEPMPPFGRGPDRERHRAEEQRRFELIEAHWDVVLEDVDLEA